MSDDPLAEFRKGKPERKAAGAAGRLDTYEAYKPQDKVVALNIHLTAGPSRSPAYHHLLDVAYGRHHYTAFRLIFSFMSVKVTGENLKEVIDAIILRKCAQIQEFNSEEFEPPAPGTPVIRKIEFVVKTLADDIAEAQRD